MQLTQVKEELIVTTLSVQKKETLIEASAVHLKMVAITILSIQVDLLINTSATQIAAAIKCRSKQIDQIRQNNFLQKDISFIGLTLKTSTKELVKNLWYRE